MVYVGLSRWFSDKEPACHSGDAGDVGLIAGLGRFPGGGHGNPLQYSHLEKPCGERSLAGHSLWGRRVRHDGSELAHMQASRPGHCITGLF